MKNNDKKFFEFLSNSIDLEMNFNEIDSQINLQKYQKEKKIVLEQKYKMNYHLMSVIF